MEQGPLVIEIVLEGEDALTEVDETLPPAMQILRARQRPTPLAARDLAGRPFVRPDGSQLYFFRAMLSYISPLVEDAAAFRNQVVRLLSHMIEEAALLYSFEPAAIIARPRRLGRAPVSVFVFFRCMAPSEGLVREKTEPLREYIDEHLHDVEEWNIRVGRFE